jgi:hypothetical protein
MKKLLGIVVLGLLLNGCTDRSSEMLNKNISDWTGLDLLGFIAILFGIIWIISVIVFILRDF